MCTHVLLVSIAVYSLAYLHGRHQQRLNEQRLRTLRVASIMCRGVAFRLTNPQASLNS